MKKLTATQIASALEELPDWSEVSGTIQRTYGFKDFGASLAFVGAIGAAAEADQHHPDILIRYNKVTLTLSTHDAGGITKKDFAFARKADALAASPGP